MWGRRNKKEIYASSGNRTRAARVAGEHSTTEPTMLRYNRSLIFGTLSSNIDLWHLNRASPCWGAKGKEWSALGTTQGKSKKCASPSGNRTPVSCVTGRDTYHYTNEDWLIETQKQAKTIGASAGRREKKRNLAAGHHDQQCSNNVKRQGGKGKKKYPSNRIRTSDLRISALLPLQSSALPTELSKAHSISWTKLVNNSRATSVWS